MGRKSRRAVDVPPDCASESLITTTRRAMQTARTAQIRRGDNVKVAAVIRAEIFAPPSSICNPRCVVVSLLNFSNFIYEHRQFLES